MQRTFVIGDIHGGLKALKEILKKANITSADTLIFLGDYVDGWSDSALTVSYLITLSKRQQCFFIRGNHDDLCYQWLANNKHNPEWLQHGGQATLNGYKILSDQEKRLHITFYEEMHNYLILENRLFLHAGFTNLKGPEFEYFSKTYFWDRTLWETALATDPNMDKTDRFYPKRFKLHNEVFIGHTPVTRIGETIPMNAQNVWNIDTGAAFKGPLTIMNVATKEYWQSTPVYQLYPEETGRN